MTPVSMNKRSKACPARARGSGTGSPKQYYYHTLLIAKNGKFISSEDDLHKIYSALDFLRETKKLNISEVRLEQGDHRNHLHALIVSHKKSIYAKMYQLPGFYIGIQPRRSESKYRSYTMKEQEISKWYQNNYGFED